jgi:hypothetical protein
MTESDAIIQGIQNLSNLQGKNTTILENVTKTNRQSKDINDVVIKLPSYIDKCNYVKTLSEKFINRAADSSNRANDIVELIGEMKQYIGSAKLESCKGGSSIKQRILSDLQTIQNASYFIVRPEQRGDYEQYSYVDSPIVVSESSSERRGGTTRRKRRYKRIRRNTLSRKRSNITKH